jgi:uncharacterized protein
MMIIQRAHTAIEIPMQIKAAHSWWTRLVGLLGTGSLADGHGLWLQPCGSIHTIGMRYKIDVVFLDKKNVIRKLAKRVSPFRFCLAPKATFSVVEFSAGAIERLGLQIDDQLILRL